MSLHYVCASCHAHHGVDRAVWRCECGGRLDLSEPDPFEPGLIDGTQPGLWRYRSALPPLPEACRIRLGETMTPLVYSERAGVNFKLDYLLPTGSFKDRGTVVMLSRLRSLGVTDVVDDSSGNAGASVATYAAAGGMGCEIFVPGSNSPGKLAQVRATGAKLTAVAGGRDAAAAAALAAAEDRFYASHNRHPDFVAGVATMGLELYEQLGGRTPSAIVAPCGQGSVLLGLARAFEALRAGTGAPVPRLFAIQAAAYGAVADAHARGLDAPVPVAQAGGTLAEGIAIEQPIRGAELLLALRLSGGRAIAVSEADIRRATVCLAGWGFYVEPTSATALAGLWALRDGGELPKQGPDTVVILTGSGLKAGDKIARLRELAEAAPGSLSGIPQAQRTWAT